MSDCIVVKDNNGTQIADGNSVVLIKDSKSCRIYQTIKRGTLMKNIRLTRNIGDTHYNTKSVKSLVLRTEFPKKP